MAYIVDADRNICKGDRTGVWINKKFYKCKPDNGVIFIPYARNSQMHKVIMIHEDFAQLSNFEQKCETYEFKVFFHVNSEQCLVGQEAQVLIRPQLTINGRKASVNLLKNTKVSLRIKDYVDSP